MPKLRLSALVFLLLFSISVFAQPEDAGALKAKAQVLVDQLRLPEALPMYERLAQLTPNDTQVHYYLGLCLIAEALKSGDDETGRQMRIRARNEFIKAKDLGDDSLIIKGFIDGMAADGSLGKGFSDNAEASKLMDQAEVAFSSGKLDDAFAKYQAALKIDPRCYYAALFSGDIYTQREKFDEALIWYKKAIAIDPDVETAYRYSATPLMKQGKYDLARDLYIESYIRAPYNRLAMNGISQWAQITKTGLGHPRVDIPESKTGADGKENTTINVNPLADDGSMAWIAYSATRETWKKEKFSKTFPKENAYRHSVAEEADALRSVVSMAKTLKPKKLNPQIAMIESMDKDGVLEAFVLMAIPDQGIARDHPRYMREHADKLRLYVSKFVIEKK